MTDVTLYRRHHCGLCDEALFALRELSREFRFAIVERDIDDDAHLCARYDEVVPVVTIGDLEVARAPIDAADLRAALESTLRSRATA
jgi:hypothetical protein